MIKCTVVPPSLVYTMIGKLHYIKTILRKYMYEGFRIYLVVIWSTADSFPF